MDKILDFEEMTKASIKEKEPYILPKYELIEYSLDVLRTYKEIHKDETSNKILNDIIINKPTTISFQNYDIINTQRIKYKYLSDLLSELLFIDETEVVLSDTIQDDD